MQDIAVKPAVSDPNLNTVECLTGGHRKAAAFPGVQQALHGVCWCVLIIALGISSVASQVVLMKLGDFANSAKNADKSKAAALLLLLLFVLVVGFILMFVPFVPFKNFPKFDPQSDFYLIAFVVSYLLVFIRRIFWWLRCTPKQFRVISITNLVKGHKLERSTNIWSCIVHPALFTSLHHLLWIVLGIITEPFWAVPVLMAICTVLFVFYYLVYQYHKGFISIESPVHSAQALAFSFFSFLLVGLFIFTLLVVGQAFLSESLIANVVQSALVIVTTLWFSMLNLRRLRETLAQNEVQMMEKTLTEFPLRKSL